MFGIGVLLWARNTPVPWTKHTSCPCFLKISKDRSESLCLSGARTCFCWSRTSSSGSSKRNFAHSGATTKQTKALWRRSSRRYSLQNCPICSKPKCKCTGNQIVVSAGSYFFWISPLTSLTLSSVGYFSAFSTLLKFLISLLSDGEALPLNKNCILIHVFLNF